MLKPRPEDDNDDLAKARRYFVELTTRTRILKENTNRRNPADRRRKHGSQQEQRSSHQTLLADSSEAFRHAEQSVTSVTIQPTAATAGGENGSHFRTPSPWTTRRSDARDSEGSRGAATASIWAPDSALLQSFGRVGAGKHDDQRETDGTDRGSDTPNPIRTPKGQVSQEAIDIVAMVATVLLFLVLYVSFFIPHDAMVVAVTLLGRYLITRYFEVPPKTAAGARRRR